MPDKLTMHPSQVTDSGTVVSAPADSNVEVLIGSTTLARVGKVLEVRDPPPLLADLGLPPETPLALLLQALRDINGSQTATADAKRSALLHSALFKWLPPAANPAQIASLILQAQQLQLLPAYVETLSSFF